MPYPKLPTYVRKDPYGPRGHNDLLQRTDHLAQQFAAEHDPISGVHNTPRVARTLGHVAWGGASYSKSGFNGYLSSVSNPAVGTVQLNFSSAFDNDGFTTDQAIVEVQPADDTGGSDGHPWLATAQWVDALTLRVHLKKNVAALAAQQDFDPVDGDFFIGIRRPQLASTPAGSPSGRRLRGQGLRVSGSDWNPAIQKLGDHRLASLVEHTSAGLHNSREVSKAWGFAIWNSTTSTYQWAGHQGLGAGLTRQGTGHIRIRVANSVPPISAPVQAFARPHSAATVDEHTGLRVAHVPEGSCGTSTIDVFLYEAYVDAGPIYSWRRVDGDFFVRVHGA